MALKYVEEKIEIPLYNEFDTSTVESDERITIGFDLKENKTIRVISEDDIDATIYLDVPTYVRG